MHCNMEGNGREAVWSGVISSVSEVDVPDVVNVVKEYRSNFGKLVFNFKGPSNFHVSSILPY